jgi:hypothetical protein
MPSPFELYPLVVRWLQAMELAPHPAALGAVAHLVTALLAGQSLRPSALMRALLSSPEVPARQRYKRVARPWTRPWLTPDWLTPRLVRATLALVALAPVAATVVAATTGSPAPLLAVPGQARHLALDSVRCGKWEVFTLGVVFHGRVLVVGWAVLPYPWPKKRFTPTVCALLRQVAAAWPAEVPAHLVADRAFPSHTLFQALRTVGWGWTLRLQARSWVTVAGQAQWARALLVGARVGVWTLYAGTFGSGPQAIPGHLVVGRGLVVLPAHQRTAGSLRHRARQHARRQQHLASKHPGRSPDASRETDAWVILFTSHAAGAAARGSYRLRWGTEGSYRDAQGGWDGQHGWNLEPVLARAADAGHVARVVGLWALGALLQTWLGQQVRLPTAPAPVQAVVAQWTTTGRLSVWAHGQFALGDRSGELRDWLSATLTAGTAHLAAAPPPAEHPVPALDARSAQPRGAPTRRLAPPRRPQQRAA